MMNRRSTVHHNYEGTFTAQEIDQQLEEGVDGKSLEIVVSRDSWISKPQPGNDGACLVDVS